MFAVIIRITVAKNVQIVIESYQSYQIYNKKNMSVGCTKWIKEQKQRNNRHNHEIFIATTDIDSNAPQ